jgi:hypothetical protein
MGFLASKRVKFVCVFLGITAGAASAQDAEVSAEEPKSPLYVEYFHYEEPVFSQSRKSELGERSDIDMSLRYDYNRDTFGRFSFGTDPTDNPVDNKTSKFETLLHHKMSPFDFQIDLDLKTNDTSSGGISIGPDLDSDDSYIAYGFLDHFNLVFYPYSFGGAVGRKFETDDVTEIYFVEGSPSTINTTPINEEIRSKTLPGLELRWSPKKDVVIFVAAGAASYLYPADENFIMTESAAVSRWEWRQDVGGKVGASYKDDNFRARIIHVEHDKSRETGSLLASASSLDLTSNLGPVVVNAEYTTTKAGKRPYRLARSGNWFEDVTPFYPIYSDFYGVQHDWIGKQDYAWALETGYQIGSVLPYVGYKYQGPHFIFNDRRSAHRLRTGDETKSHGGLHVFSLGSNVTKGNFSITPELEWLAAKNAVFDNNADVKQDRRFASQGKKEFMLTLYLTYQDNRI